STTHAASAPATWAAGQESVVVRTCSTADAAGDAPSPVAVGCGRATTPSAGPPPPFTSAGPPRPFRIATPATMSRSTAAATVTAMWTLVFPPPPAGPVIWSRGPSGGCGGPGDPSGPALN